MVMVIVRLVVGENQRRATQRAQAAPEASASAAKRAKREADFAPPLDLARFSSAALGPQFAALLLP